MGKGRDTVHKYNYAHNKVGLRLAKIERELFNKAVREENKRTNPVFYIPEHRAYTYLFKHENVKKVFDVRHFSSIPNDVAKKMGVELYHKGIGSMAQKLVSSDKVIKEINCDLMIAITPAKNICEDIKNAWEYLPDGTKIYALAPYSFLESEKRNEFFKEYPIKKMLISPSRYRVAKNGDFSNTFSPIGFSKSNINYAWYVWEKGWSGSTTIEWFEYDINELYDTKTKIAKESKVRCTLTDSAKALVNRYS